MRITRETEYAIRMLRALTDYEIKAVKTICDEENIPYKFAYKILKKMERRNMVKAFQGSRGGYRLNKEISKISMLDILEMNPKNLQFANRCSCAGCTKNTGECGVNNEFTLLKDTISLEFRKRTMDKVILVG